MPSTGRQFAFEQIQQDAIANTPLITPRIAPMRASGPPGPLRDCC